MKFTYILSLLLVVCFLNSCKKKTSICPYTISYSYTTQVGFKGFSADDLDTILIERYEGGKYPEGKIKVDTVITPEPYFVNDTAYLSSKLDGFADPAGFVEIAANVDFHIILSNGSAFMITGASIGPTSGSYEVEGDCSPGAAEPHISTLLNIHIDGKEVYPATLNHYNPWYIYLTR